MKIILSARGSLGDVQPITDVAVGLRRHGHDVVLCVPATFADYVGGLGVNTAFYSEDSREMMNHFGNGWRGLKKTLKWFSKTIDDQFDVLVAQSNGADVMMTGTNEIAAPSVAEYRGIPFYRITFAPMMVGYTSNPLIPWQDLPGLVNRAAWSGINAGVELMSRNAINRNRESVGLRPIKGVGQHVAQYGHTLFSMNTTLAPPCPSWGCSYDFSYTGYCHRTSNVSLQPDLERFIDDGSPPVYIGFGSVTVPNPQRFTRTVIDAIVMSSRRAVLGKGWTGLGRGAISKRIFVVEETPHDVLFPRMAGVFHHGGAGTTHTAARAGVPQMALPQFADQHYWGHRIAALGLGPKPVPPQRIRRGKLANVLCDITDSRQFRQNAAALGHMMRDEDGVSSIIAAVVGREASESLVTGPSTHPLPEVATG
jgi:UDP:flavonoid glycosyltransferase YjiC (YdhE family)